MKRLASCAILCILQATAPNLAAAEPETTEEAQADSAAAGSAGSLSPYEPIYAAFDLGGEEIARLQLSFKYRPLNPDGPLARRMPWLADLYFGYTQTSLWDIDTLSKPFKDTSYQPRLFYRQDRLPLVSSAQRQVGIETGVGHESNGEDDIDSRSIDILYVRPMLRVGDPRRHQWVLAPMFYTYLDKKENPDIHRYRGYVDLLLGFEKYRNWHANMVLRRGTSNSRGSVELNTSYPLERIGVGDFVGFLHLQYFNGYGESILDYDRKLESRLRIGLMFLR